MRGLSILELTMATWLFLKIETDPLTIGNTEICNRVSLKSDTRKF